MGYARIPGELTSRIGRPVRFGPPQDIAGAGATADQGTIIDEVWQNLEANRQPARARVGAMDWGDYSFCSQLIRWDDGSLSVRLAYYRRRAGQDHWEYASQMTVNAEPAIIKSLLEKTLARTDWFDANVSEGPTAV
jgi:hypothetical protein